MTGHASVKGHLNKIGVYKNGDLLCRLCHKAPETAKHRLRDCETLDHKRHTLFGKLEVDSRTYRTRQGLVLINKNQVKASLISRYRLSNECEEGFKDSIYIICQCS